MSLKANEMGKLELAVRMDYSEAYRENDKLDVDLDEHLINLTRSAQRVLTEKDEELELAKAEAERNRKLKEAVNTRQDSTTQILCQSPPSRLRRTNSELSSISKRRTSMGSLISRRASIMSKAQNSVDEVDGHGEENDVQDYAVLASGQVVDTRKLSSTERRLAMERDQFSSKNLFNVKRRNSGSSFNFLESNASKTDNSQDSLKNAMSAMTISVPRVKDRPKTSPSAYNHKRANNRGYLRPTTSSASRLSRFSGESLSAENYEYYGRPRRPRSRRELETLSRLNINPFEDDEPERPKSWSPSGNIRQDMLDRLRSGRPQLQARVSAFLKGMEEFNKRGQKSGLEQILEAT